MNPLLKTIFDFVANLTTPAAGNRTALSLVGALGLLVYAVVQHDYAQGSMALTMILAIIGLKPQPPALPE